MPKEYERFPAAQPVWVRPGLGHWYPGYSTGRLRWPGMRWNEQEVEYATGSGATHHDIVWADDVCSRHPMAAPERNAPCARCGTSREDCDRREQAEWPPYCCPQCRRSKEKYSLHVWG